MPRPQLTPASQPQQPAVVQPVSSSQTGHHVPDSDEEDEELRKHTLLRAPKCPRRELILPPQALVDDAPAWVKIVWSLDASAR